MTSYTINKSRRERFIAWWYSVLTVKINALYWLLLHLLRSVRKLHKAYTKKENFWFEQSQSVTFRINKVELMDSWMLKIWLMTEHDGQKWFVHHEGDYRELLKQNKGKELEVTEQHYFIAANSIWKKL